jgi:hypothetical protein
LRKSQPRKPKRKELKMEKVTKVIMNEQHSLLPEQEALLNDKFGKAWEILPIPASGLKLAEMKELAKELSRVETVFCSPIPALMILVAGEHHYDACQCDGGCFFKLPMWVFHNDRRVAKELPNGKVIHTVAKEGWQLV